MASVQVGFCMLEWQRTEARGDGVVAVRWQKGRDESSPGLDFVVDASGPRMDTLEIDRGLTAVDVAGVLLMESTRSTQRGGLPC